MIQVRRVELVQCPQEFLQQFPLAVPADSAPIVQVPIAQHLKNAGHHPSLNLYLLGLVQAGVAGGHDYLVEVGLHQWGYLHGRAAPQDAAAESVDVLSLAQRDVIEQDI